MWVPESAITIAAGTPPGGGLDRVARALADRREGAVQLHCRLDCAGGPLFLEVGLFRPSAEPGHLCDLLQMQLEQAALSGPVGRVTLEARLTAQENAAPAADAPDAASIIADYSKATALWQDILTRFPSYRQTPSTLYLLAYYGKTKDERKSLQVFLALACANKYKWNDPPSKPPTREEALKRIERKDLRDPYAD